MSRPAGRRSHDYEEKRTALAQAVVPLLLTGERPSLRDLAAAAGVQVNTLRHYFGDREGLVIAAIAQVGASGAPWIAATRALGQQEPATALGVWLGWLRLGWLNGLNNIHRMGLQEGLGVERAGQAYLNSVLEPTLHVLEELIADWMARGQLLQGDPRIAGLGLLAPVLVALLHQHDLGGQRCRPLPMEAFLTEHLQSWLRAWTKRDEPTSKQHIDVGTPSE